MKIRLAVEIETRRWIVDLLDGEFAGRSGDYTLKGGTDPLRKGDVYVVSADPLRKGDVYVASPRGGRLPFPPTCSHSSGTLFLEERML